MAVILFFGLPGSGKSTYAAKIVHDNTKRNIKTYCNFPVSGAIPFSAAEFGERCFCCGDMIIDEAGIDFNSRYWKAVKSGVIDFLKRYRHFHIRNIYVFSQAPDDVDITIRRLASSAFYVRRSIFGLSTLRELRLYFEIDEQTHEPHIGWRFRKPNFPRFFFRPRYYRMFESTLPVSVFSGVIEPSPYS